MGKRVLILVSCLCLLVGLVLPVPSLAAQLDGVDLSLQVTGREPVIVKGFQSSYDNNWILSLRDLASALVGTEKAFCFWKEHRDFEMLIFTKDKRSFATEGLKNKVDFLNDSFEVYWKNYF